MTMPAFTVSSARSPVDIVDATALFRAYAASLDVDLAYQGFEAEMAAMPGRYAPPAGELLLARGIGGEALGAVGLRAIEPAGCCEMKRLYVAPAARGLGVGAALVDAIAKAAARIGYDELRLDTLPTMTGAIALYLRLGFEEIAPYYDTPVAGTVFLRKRLRPNPSNLDRSPSHRP
jgi:ribosomal protein S18 acetylase RimI-like enzyme